MSLRTPTHSERFSTMLGFVALTPTYAGSTQPTWADMKKTAIFWVPFFVVLLAFVGFAVAVYEVIGRTKIFSLYSSGLIGESFGVLNSLFAGLGFAGIVIALFLQQRQIAIQQSELTTTQNELRKQSLLFEQQRFEDSFYALLRMWRENLTSLYSKPAHEGADSALRGVDVLTARLKKFRTAMKEAKFGSFPESDDLRNAFLWELWKIVNDSLGRQARYVETVASLVRWISERCPAGTESKPYWEIATAQLTVYESAYLFYQILNSTPDHPLRVYCNVKNPFFLQLFRNAQKRSHAEALLWFFNGYEQYAKVAPRPSLFDRKQLRKARKAMRAYLRDQAISKVNPTSNSSQPVHNLSDISPQASPETPSR